MAVVTNDVAALDISNTVVLLACRGETFYKQVLFRGTTLSGLTGRFDMSAAPVPRITYNLEISVSFMDSFCGGPSLRKKTASHEQDEEEEEEKEGDLLEEKREEEEPENKGEAVSDAKKNAAGAGKVGKKLAARTSAKKRPAADMSQLESHDHGYETVDGSTTKKRKKPRDEKAIDDGVQVENDFVTKKLKKAYDEGDDDNNVSVVKTSLASGGHLVEVGTEWWVLVTKRTGRGSVGQNRYAYISRRVPDKKIYNLGEAVNAGFPCLHWGDLKRDKKHEVRANVLEDRTSD